MLRYTYIVCLLCYCIRQHKKTVTYLQFWRNNRGNALSVVSSRLVEACHNLYWNNDTLESNRFFHTATLREIPAIHNFHFVLVAFLHTIRGELRRFREQWQSDFLRLIRNPNHEFQLLYLSYILSSLWAQQVSEVCTCCSNSKQAVRRQGELEQF